jgi:hypothetical protein
MHRRASALFIAMALVLVPTTAVARPRTYVTSDCAHARIRPDGIMFACADGGYFVRRLEWSTWRVRTAVARGLFHQNDCQPSCAGGTFHNRRGELRLIGRRWCPDIDRFVFRRAVVDYDRPLLGARTTRFPLFCPL